ncbi:glycerol uptake facilitator-like aquaporin [Paraburkholderia sp. CI2]|uniref:aquaporin n=1 Tax=Paraburkholderia sp. CI2 TaxID=2723093 RepID=UPI00161C120B|nr:aquaporin [Paraburkholderia sp. CI2]MBB5464226.1 glycerol uptake facilitator-like aquaporin [Paraburkholderia sp. CI2]
MNSTPANAVPTCFVEADPQLQLARRATVECIGTLLLTTVAAGAGLAATQAEPGNHGFALLLGALATSGALVGLIFAFGKVSGGHFNPLITLLQWLTRERTGKCAAAYVTGQLIGAALGAGIANTLFPTPSMGQAITTPTVALVASEFIASAGLMTIVFGCMRSGLAVTGPIAVGAWLFAAIIATPSGSYANPAITVASLIAHGPIHLSVQTVWLYTPAELFGALLALLIVAIGYPRKDLPDAVDQQVDRGALQP